MTETLTDIIDFDLHHAVHPESRERLQTMEKEHPKVEGYSGVVPSLMAILFLMFALSMGPIITHPLKPIQEEPDRDFIYWTSVIYHVVVVAFWIITLKTLTPGGMLSILQAISTGAFAVGFSVLTNAIAVEEWFGPSLYPVPYSLVFTGTAAFFGVVVLMLKVMPANRKDLRDYGRVFLIICILAFIPLLAGLTAALTSYFRIHHNTGVQFTANLIQSTTRFLVKNFLLGPLTKKAAAHNFVVINLSVDITFSLATALTNPYIDWYGFLIIILLDTLMALFRCSGGVDRMALLKEGFSPIFSNARSKLAVHTLYGRTFWQAFRSIASGSLQEITNHSQIVQPRRENRGRPWVDRALFHYLDVIGGRVISILVRLFALIVLWVARSAPTMKGFLHDHFVVSDAVFYRGLGYGLGTVLFQVLTLCYIGKYRLPELQMKNRKGEDKPILMNSVLYFLFLDCFLIVASALASAAVFFVSGVFIQFGGDLSFEFSWLS